MVADPPPPADAPGVELLLSGDEFRIVIALCTGEPLTGLEHAVPPLVERGLLEGPPEAPYLSRELLDVLGPISSAHTLAAVVLPGGEPAGVFAIDDLTCEIAETGGGVRLSLLPGDRAAAAISAALGTALATGAGTAELRILHDGSERSAFLRAEDAGYTLVRSDAPAIAEFDDLDELPEVVRSVMEGQAGASRSPRP